MNAEKNQRLADGLNDVLKTEEVPPSGLEEQNNSDIIEIQPVQ